MKQTTEKTTTPTTFADLVKAYNADPESAKTLTDLATATTFAVLKKVINTTGNPMLQTVRKELTRDLHDLDRLAYSNDNATRLAFNSDGDLVSEVLDPALVKAAADLAGLPLGDGLDLVNDAVVAILSERAKQADRDLGLPLDMERPYTVRRLKRKVWIKTAESVKAWETVETTPIQEVYKAIRRSIDNSRSMQTDPRNGYTYLADLATDPESGDQTAIYRRLPRYADIGGHVCDFNGKETVATTADRETVESLDRLVAAMNLSDREATVLKYRLSGYGKKAIATAMGLSESSVATVQRRIKDKATASGLTVK